jgi:hypothetical protein
MKAAKQQARISGSKTKEVLVPASDFHRSEITRQPRPETRLQVARFTRWIDLGPAYPQSTTSATSTAFTLGSIPGASEIRAMYDFYRITRVDMCYYPASRAGPSSPTTTNSAPVMAVGPDYDENIGVSFATMLERSTTQVYSVYDKWQVTFEPRLSTVAYGNGVSNGYLLGATGQWVDTSASSADPTYYGFNWTHPPTAAAIQFGGRVMARVHIECAMVI